MKSVVFRTIVCVYSYVYMCEWITHDLTVWDILIVSKVGKFQKCWGEIWIPVIIDWFSQKCFEKSWFLLYLR